MNPDLYLVLKLNLIEYNWLRNVYNVSVADPGCVSRILIFTRPGSRIQDPGSKTATKEMGG
jgi:hypothetical protein